MPLSCPTAKASTQEPPGEEPSGAGSSGGTGSDRNKAVGARNTSAFPVFSKTIKWEHSRRTRVAPGDREIGDPRRHQDSPPALHPPHPEGTGTRRGALPPQPSPTPPGGRHSVWGGGEAGSPPRAAYRVHGRPSPRPPGHRRRRHGASSSSSTAPRRAPLARPTPPLRPPWPRGAPVPVPAPVPARLPEALGLGLGRARGRAEEPRHGRRHLRADGNRPRPRGASARPAAAMGAREPCRRLEAVLGALYDLGG